MKTQLSIIGSIYHQDGYEVRLYRSNDGRFIRRESLPYEKDREDGRERFPHSRFDEISSSALHAYCREYFRRSPEECWGEIWTREAKQRHFVGGL